MAQHLDAKASLAVGEKKVRLEGLAAATRILASVALEQEGGIVREPRSEPATLPAHITNEPKAVNHQRHRQQAEMPRVAEAQFYPAFHPEARLRVIAGLDGTTLELTSAENRFARQITHKNVVAPEYALRFWSDLDAMLLAPSKTEETFGFDGITVKVDCRTPAGSASFEVWSPQSATYGGRLVDLIYNIALETSATASAIKCLEHLHGYLRDELPARIIDGPITRLRLFGRLTTSHQRSLQELFKGLLRKAPLLIDMTDFDGMGTTLYGVFKEFSASHQCVVFATSTSSRRLLEEMQIPPSRLYDRVEDAIDFLKAK